MTGLSSKEWGVVEKHRKRKWRNDCLRRSQKWSEKPYASKHIIKKTPFQPIVFFMHINFHCYKAPSATLSLDGMENLLSKHGVLRDPSIFNKSRLVRCCQLINCSEVVLTLFSNTWKFLNFSLLIKTTYVTKKHNQALKPKPINR